MKNFGFTILILIYFLSPSSQKQNNNRHGFPPDFLHVYDDENSQIKQFLINNNDNSDILNRIKRNIKENRNEENKKFDSSLLSTEISSTTTIATSSIAAPTTASSVSSNEELINQNITVKVNFLILKKTYFSKIKIQLKKCLIKKNPYCIFFFSFIHS